MKNNTMSFGQRLLHFSIGPLVGACISFLTIPITTFFISPEEYGKASMFLVVQMLVTAYVYVGVDQSYTREYHEIDDKTHLFQHAVLIPFSMTTVLSILCLFNMDTLSISVFGSANNKMLVILFIISMYGMIIERFLLLSIRMAEKAIFYSFCTILIKLVIFLLTVGLLIWWKRDFLAVVYGTIGGQLLADIALGIVCRRLFDYRKFILDLSLIKKMILFGFPVFIAFSIEGMFITMDRIALKMYSDLENIGLYTAALKLASLLKILQSSFTSFWTPTAYRWFHQKKSMEFFQVVSDAVVCMFSIFYVIVLLLKDNIRYLFTNEYADVIYIFPFLCFAPILYTISETTTLGIVFSKKTYLNIIVSLSAAIVHLTFLLILIPYWGARGAAISSGIAYFIYYCIRTVLSNKMWPGIRIKKQIFIILVLFVIASFNTFDAPFTTWVNVLGLLVCVSSYVSTIKKIAPYFSFIVQVFKRK
ncbi:lipopolysaccharide biosynthesis protein [Bacillus wiedmannii]|uniref:lipopolysaccharide biosynthesis protein n=1 Tax=Bacillus wiedmannii TaxID=1890302 RepID=UPI000BEF9BEA|nr:oligosaccharide flippase family protein [Bacillus wiedmannii]PEO38847.1 polysaccharide biosynthesis protein [Bacillus wiedmannii]